MWDWLKKFFYPGMIKIVNIFKKKGKQVCNMNSEAQEIVNAQVERRLTVLENDMKEVKGNSIF